MSNVNEGRSKRREAERHRHPTPRGQLHDARRSVEFVVVARFVGVSLAFLVGACVCLDSHVVADTVVRRYCDFIAGTVRGGLNLVGMHAHGDGPYVVVPNCSMRIITGCTGLDISAVIAGSIIGFPAGWKSKLAGCVSTLSAIGLANLARVGILVVMGSRLGQRFEDVHLIYAQGMTILFAIGLWILWVTRSSAYALQRCRAVHH